MIPVDPNGVMRAVLGNHGPIRALVGDNVVPLGMFTQYEDKLIVFAMRGGETNRTLDGDEAEQNPGMQIDCYASDLETAQAIHDAVYHRLTSIAQETIAGHLVMSCQVGQARDDDEPLIVGQTIPDTFFTLDVNIWLQRV
jgi:hypothetical protein